jgi:hypothetical protein
VAETCRHCRGSTRGSLQGEPWRLTALKCLEHVADHFMFLVLWVEAGVADRHRRCRVRAQGEARPSHSLQAALGRTCCILAWIRTTTSAGILALSIVLSLSQVKRYTSERCIYLTVMAL